MAMKLSIAFIVISYFFCLLLLPLQTDASDDYSGKRLDDHFVAQLLPNVGLMNAEAADDKISLLPVIETETRWRMLLDGTDWMIAFCPSCNTSQDLINNAEQLDFEQAVVPSAFAENFPFNSTMRNYFGWLLYRRQRVFTHRGKSLTNNKRLVIRFESVLYQADIFVNEIKVGTHYGGHLPFEFDLSKFLKPGADSFDLDVAVNTVLTYDTIPPGEMKTDPDTNFTYQDYLFDFFHYCGILRSVWLYSTPQSYVLDATVATDSVDLSSGSASINFNISLVCDDSSSNCLVESQIYDGSGTPVGPVLKGPQQHNIHVANAMFWTQSDYRSDKSENVHQLYDLAISVKQNGIAVDIYYLPFGIRKMSFNRTGVFINNQPLYCRGVGKHEDWPLLGRAVSKQAILHDFRILRWLGGNCLRTSHYPYDDYFYQLADQFGVAIISESPGVQIRYVETFKSAQAQVQHAFALTEMYQHLKHHPSIIAWSLANEPLVTAKQSRPYFQPLFALMRTLDNSRPVTFVDGDLALPPNNYMSDLADISCINRYFGWYDQPGQLDYIEKSIMNDLLNFSTAYPDKPIIMTEFGAEAISGIHGDDDQLFSEDYQVRVLSKYHSAFDKILAAKSAPLIGELVWNYADFAARPRDLSRVNGLNNKGIFNRNRQPKESAHLVRKRYNAIMPKRNISSEKKNDETISVAKMKHI